MGILDNPLHLAVLLVILLLVFGAKRLPEMGRSLGSGLRSFKESINPDDDHAELPAMQTPPVHEDATSAPDRTPTAPMA